MKRYALVKNGVVQEMVEAFYKLEEQRPPAPENMEKGEDLTEEQIEDRITLQALHDDYIVGEVEMIERFHPDFLAQYEVVPTEDDAITQGYIYGPQGFNSPPPYSPSPMTETEALEKRDQFLATATLRIAPLQDAVDLDDATTEEIAELKAWKQYRVKLSRINTLPGYPGSFTWPGAPQ